MTKEEMKDFQKNLFLLDVENGFCELDGTPVNRMLSKDDNLHYFSVLSSFYIQRSSWVGETPTYKGWMNFLQEIEKVVRYGKITSYVRDVALMILQSDVTEEGLVKYLD